MKENRRRIFIIGMILFLIPIIIGAVFYNKMPDMLPSHFDMTGTADKFESKAKVLFGMPLTMIALYAFSYFIMKFDPRRENQNINIFTIIMLLIPVLTTVATVITVMYGFGKRPDVPLIVGAFTAVLFIAIGNYMPKLKFNYTIGIRVPWTLDSEENWNKTHRFAGFVFTICGIICLILSFVKIKGSMYASFAVIVIMGILPELYSFLLYKKGV